MGHGRGTPLTTVEQAFTGAGYAHPRPMGRPAAHGLLTVLAAFATLLALAAPASAHHTDPNAPLTPTPVLGEDGEGGLPRGQGTWEHVRNFPAHQASDVTFFRKGGELYAAHGTFGQGPAGSVYVGQRILRLLDADGRLDPRFRADHGSAACDQPATSATGLQHDSFATPPEDAQILTDATDAIGRCHDPDGGGIELIDVSGLDDPDFEPREVHLLRFNATTHTTTLDPDRPWIIFSNNSDFSGRNWLDFADIRSCLTTSAGGTLADDATLEQRQQQCRPQVYRIPFQDQWTQQTFDDSGPAHGTPAMCHDTVIEDGILYCSGLNAEVLLDISELTDDNGDPRGEPLPCRLISPEDLSGAPTDAFVTDCALGGPTADEPTARAAWEDAGSPQATGWRLLGFYNHPGRSDGAGGTTGNTNLEVPADQGVAVSHETRPLPATVHPQRRFMVVSDERGGGVVPGGANCTADGFDEFNHGGLHFFDVTDPGNITYATMLDEDGEEVRAVWRGDIVVPSGTFCVVHRFRHLPDEQRIVMAYYSQGIKILDYELDADGRFRFDEVASFTLPEANSWTADVFHTVDNADGTRTYFIASSDTIGSTPLRGLDVLTWTHMPNPISAGAQAPTEVLTRVSGANRFETAARISQERFPAASSALLARADDYADALAGGPLAAQLGAPTLLTERDRLTPVTEAELERLDVDEAILLGGEAAIGPAVAERLREMGLTVRRIAGANRFGTAAAVARELDSANGGFQRAFLVEGGNPDPARGWPDAVSAAPYAAFAGEPVVLATRDELPAETAAVLDELAIGETVVVGGSAAVSDAVVAELADRGHGPRRLAGRERYETSTAVHREALQAGMDPATVWLATGRDWPDALAAGGVVGATGDAFLLVDGQGLSGSPASRDALEADADRIDEAMLMGGTAAITAATADEVATIISAGASNQHSASATRTGAGAAPLSTDALLVLLAVTVVPTSALLGRRRRLRG